MITNDSILLQNPSYRNIWTDDDALRSGLVFVSADHVTQLAYFFKIFVAVNFCNIFTLLSLNVIE